MTNQQKTPVMLMAIMMLSMGIMIMPAYAATIIIDKPYITVETNQKEYSSCYKI